MIESQIAASEQQDIRNHLETPMGNVSDDGPDEEEEKQPALILSKFESENYLDNLTELLKKIKIMGKPISF